MPIQEKDFILNLNRLKKELYVTKPDITFDDASPERQEMVRNIRHVLTDYVITVSTPDSIENLIYLIDKLVEKVFDKYYEVTGNKLFFIYRGGNIIKIYREVFEDHIPRNAREEFNNLFDDYFKQSDLDFYVIIENHTLPEETLEQIAADAQAMVYECLCIAREEINGSNFKYLSFTRYKDSYRSSTLQPFLIKLAETFNSLGLEYGPSRDDFVVLPSGLAIIPYIKKFHLFKRTPTYKSSPLYVSTNTGIRNNEEGMAFRLSRLMINFVLSFSENERMNVSSELFDVSIGLPQDKLFKTYNKHSFRMYNYGLGRIRIPTLRTLLKDLHVILFEYRPFPWLDPKYVKRLKRYIVLLFIYEFTRAGITDIIKQLQQIKNIDLPTSVSSHKISLWNIPNHVYNVKYLVNTDEDMKQYREFVKNTKETLTEMYNILIRVQDFVKKDGKLKITL